MASNLDDIKPMVLPRAGFSPKALLAIVAALIVLTIIGFSLMKSRPAPVDTKTLPTPAQR